MFEGHGESEYWDIGGERRTDTPLSKLQTYGGKGGGAKPFYSIWY